MGGYELSIRTDLLESTSSSSAAAAQAPSQSPSMRERERRRVQRQLKRAQQDANWRAFLPGADKPETVNPPELVASPSDPWPPIRGPPLDRFLRRKEVLI